MLPPYEGLEPGYFPVSPDTLLACAHTHTLPGATSVVLGPKLKPTHGICRDPTTTVGAHRGASSDAGWSSYPDGKPTSLR